MPTAQYFDLQAGKSAGHLENARLGLSGESSIEPLLHTKKQISVSAVTNRHGGVKPVSVTLQEVMFTSRVPLSTWTFAFAINEKLWVSDLTTLYFGKRTTMNRNIYRGKMFVPDRGGNITIGITAYNSYGDLFNTSRDLHISTNNAANNGGTLVNIDEDWTKLLFKFHVQIA